MTNKIEFYARKKGLDLETLRGKVDMSKSTFKLFVLGFKKPTIKEITETCILLGENRRKIFMDI